VPNIVRTMSLA